MKRIVFVVSLLLLAGCEQREEHGWLGYAEGDNAAIAAPQPGWVSRMNVERGDWVHSGELLFTLDSQAQTATRDQAQAAIAAARGQLIEAKATLALSEKELARQGGLMRANAGTKQNYDIAHANRDTAAARVRQIEAQIAQSEAALSGAAYQLSQRDVASLTEGRVQDVYFRKGEYVAAMTPVVSVLPPGNIYVRFFVPESEFSRLHLGQRVAISCDGCPKGMTARVSFIAQQEEFTPPVVFSVDSRQKLVFKVEARAPGGLKLNPGQPVDVRPL